MERQTIIPLVGIGLNLLVLMIILLRRYIPRWKERREVKRMLKNGVKFVAVKHKNNDPVNIVLVLVCTIMVLMPYAFSIFVLLSIKPYLESKDDLG